MATKIRLQRHGRKGYAYYPIVIADSRAPRDGKFIERIGSYNPNTNPATISLDFDRALYWVEVGAQPTDTVRTILSKEGVMLMKHLRGGVKKGAFTEEEAQRRFDAWKADREKVANAAAAQKSAKAAEEAKARFDAEVEKNRLKGEAVAKKKAEKLAAEEAAAKAALEAETAEAPAEEAAAKAALEAETAEAPAEEAAAE
jgi:small subunit ribosomal protein S16